LVQLVGFTAPLRSSALITDELVAMAEVPAPPSFAAAAWRSNAAPPATRGVVKLAQQ
jgi:hypothetical protein